jgi:hypothetical protein
MAPWFKVTSCASSAPSLEFVLVAHDRAAEDRRDLRRGLLAERIGKIRFQIAAGLAQWCAGFSGRVVGVDLREAETPQVCADRRTGHCSPQGGACERCSLARAGLCPAIRDDRQTVGLDRQLGAAVRPRISDITEGDAKWIGPRWSDIDTDFVLSIKPTKTEDTTEVEIAYDLSVCPMVMEELALIGEAKRTGPLVLNPSTGLPYRPDAFHDGWRKDYALAGIPKEVWNRDARAGGITEGKLSGASRDDQRRLAGHSKEEQTDDYERLTVDLDAHRKVMAARKLFREQNN